MGRMEMAREWRSRRMWGEMGRMGEEKRGRSWEEEDRREEKQE
jgi:hypothetical protein